jgi:hypothetical protein
MPARRNNIRRTFFAFSSAFTLLTATTPAGLAYPSLQGQGNSPAGETTAIVGVVLPTDVRPGDTISGSVVLNPQDYEKTPALHVIRVEVPLDTGDDGKPTLRGPVVDTGDGQPKPVDHGLHYKLPEGTLRNANRLRALFGRSGKTTIITRELPLDPSPPALERVAASTGKAADFASPPAAPALGVNVIRDPFGGDSVNTQVSVAGRQAQVMAETPRAAYYQLPHGLPPGPQQVQLAEGNRIVNFQLNVIRLNLSADRLQLQRGETTNFRATVTGLQGLPANAWRSGNSPELVDSATLPALAPGFQPPGPSEPGVILLSLQNGSPGTILMQRAVGQVIVIKLTPEIVASGTYVFEDIIRSIRSGGFAVNAVLHVFLAPSPGQETQNAENQPNQPPNAPPNAPPNNPPNAPPNAPPNLPGSGNPFGVSDLLRARKTLDNLEESARQARRATREAQAKANAQKAAGQDPTAAQKEADQAKQQAETLNQQVTTQTEQANKVASALPTTVVTETLKKKSLDYKSLAIELNRLIESKHKDAEAKHRAAKLERDLAANADSADRKKEHLEAATKAEDEAKALDDDSADLKDCAGHLEKKAADLDKQVEQMEKNPKPSGSNGSNSAARRPVVYNPKRLARDNEIGAQFAPIWYEGMGDHMRSDYITNFDFDGDWRGDNNWDNVDNLKIHIYAHVYFSVIETSTHFYVHYAVYHPRDYKGGLGKSVLLESVLHQVKEEVGGDPTGTLDSVALSHENDLERCLVVAEKNGEDPTAAIVQYVEAMAHNRYIKYHPTSVTTEVGETLLMRGQHPLMFIEPKSHGVSKYTGDPKQLKECTRGVLIYSYTGHADDQEETGNREVGYDLLPVYTTLWAHARDSMGVNETFGESYDFPIFRVLCYLVTGRTDEVQLAMGFLGVALRGAVAFPNKARPPWGWYAITEKGRPRGEWFFDPADVVKRHFRTGEKFSTAYTFNPYLNIATE